LLNFWKLFPLIDTIFWSGIQSSLACGLDSRVCEDGANSELRKGPTLPKDWGGAPPKH
jgi:hypothetical protein